MMPFYREDDKILDDFRDADCDIANLDSAHLYAVSKNNNEKRQIKTIQCSVISDTINPELGESSESTFQKCCLDRQLAH